MTGARTTSYWVIRCQPRLIFRLILPAKPTPPGSEVNLTAVASAPREELKPARQPYSDYNGGLVIAAAIDRTTVCVGRAVSGRQARVASVQFDAIDTFELDAIEPTEPGAWTRYVRGVCWALARWCGPFSGGFEATVAGDVPLGAGLSSSASLQACFGSLLIELGIVPGPAPARTDGRTAVIAARSFAQVWYRQSVKRVCRGLDSALDCGFQALFGRDGCALF